MLAISFYVVVAFTASAVVLGWIYFRNFQLARPSIGVLNLVSSEHR
jgi:L-amino acid N-acyltransferase YncA